MTRQKKSYQQENFHDYEIFGGEWSHFSRSIVTFQSNQDRMLRMVDSFLRMLIISPPNLGYSGPRWCSCGRCHLLLSTLFADQTWVKISIYESRSQILCIHRSLTRVEVPSIVSNHNYKSTFKMSRSRGFGRRFRFRETGRSGVSFAVNTIDNSWQWRQVFFLHLNVKFLFLFYIGQIWARVQKNILHGFWEKYLGIDFRTVIFPKEQRKWAKISACGELN